MLLKLTGSSGEGKTTLAFAAAGRLPGTAVHEFKDARFGKHRGQRATRRPLTRVLSA